MQRNVNKSGLCKMSLKRNSVRVLLGVSIYKSVTDFQITLGQPRDSNSMPKTVLKSVGLTTDPRISILVRGSVRPSVRP